MAVVEDVKSAETRRGTESAFSVGAIWQLNVRGAAASSAGFALYLQGTGSEA